MITPNDSMTFMSFLAVVLVVPTMLLIILAAFGKWLGMPKKRRRILRRCYAHIGQLSAGQMAIWVECERCELCRKGQK